MHVSKHQNSKKQATLQQSSNMLALASKTCKKQASPRLRYKMLHSWFIYLRQRVTPTKTDSFSNTPPGPIKFSLFVESSLACSETFPFRDGDESRGVHPNRRRTTIKRDKQRQSTRYKRDNTKERRNGDKQDDAKRG